MQSLQSFYLVQMNLLQNLCPKFCLLSMSKNTRMRQWKTDSALGLQLSLALWTPGSNFPLLQHNGKKKVLSTSTIRGSRDSKPLSCIRPLRNEIAGIDPWKSKFLKGTSSSQEQPSANTSVFSGGWVCPIQLCAVHAPWPVAAWLRYSLGTISGYPATSFSTFHPKDRFWQMFC